MPATEAEKTKLLEKSALINAASEECRREDSGYRECQQALHNLMADMPKNSDLSDMTDAQIRVSITNILSKATSLLAQ